jgi:DNA-directed RNA polymerase specialized sigma24 family protein
LNLAEAFEVLREGPAEAAGDAGDAVRTHALAVARADGRCPEAEAEDCAQEVFFELYKRLSAGADPVPERHPRACAAYVARMARNWIVDRWRKEQRRRARHERLEHERAVAVEALGAAAAGGESSVIGREERARDAALGAEVRALLERVAAFAVARRQARHRPHLERGWSEIRAIVFEEASLRALLRESGELSPAADERDFRRVRNAAYKRHERTRAALEEAAKAMRAQGELSSEEAELVRLAIGRLSRCARRTSAPAPSEEES